MSPQLERYLAMLPRNPAGGGMSPEAAVIWDVILRAQSGRNLLGGMAEIGVFKGFGASLMAAYLRDDEPLILVDLMVGIDYSGEAISEVAGPAVLERTTFHQMDSMKLARSERLSEVGEGLRFFHIDGEHSYDGVINDLGLATKTLAPHGVIVIDDFFSSASPAITHAVFDYVGMADKNLSIFLIGYNKAYICFNRWLGFYRQVAATLPDELEAHGYRSQLAAGGFSFERTYAGISNRATENKFQLVGRFIPDSETFLASTNQY